MFIGGRFLTGFGAGSAAGSKQYLVEISSPAIRGRVIGCYNSFYYVGAMLATGITIPLGRGNSTYAWRTPLYIQAVFPFINVVLIHFFHESPRWLYTRGRRDEALKVLASLHSRDNDINSPLVQLEIQEFEENLNLRGADQRFWDFRALFRTGAARYRFGLCAMVSCWGQLSGNGLITCKIALDDRNLAAERFAVRFPPSSAPFGRHRQPRPPTSAQLCQFDYVLHRCPNRHLPYGQGRSTQDDAILRDLRHGHHVPRGRLAVAIGTSIDYAGKCWDLLHL